MEHRIGAKSLPDPMNTQFTNAYKPQWVKQYERDVSVSAINSLTTGNVWRYQRSSPLLTLMVNFILMQYSIVVKKH